MTEQEIQQPKWLLELENRKRKPRLAHEAGAGSPCLSCTTACPGLDLHFWRKICKNCKCGRDEHDFCDDDFPQFDLLFGHNAKSKTQSKRLRINNKQSQNETTFDWVPPNTTKELAEDYMKALPEEKLPIKGTVGAALRKRQLQKQIPLHDIDQKACGDLTDQEKANFEQYLDNLKKCAGQGKVYKFQVQEFTPTITSPHMPEVECYNLCHATVNLRTPSSFMTKVSPAVTRQNNAVVNRPINATLSPVKMGLGQSVETSVSNVISNLGRYHRALVKDQHETNLTENYSTPGVLHPPCETLNKVSDGTKSREVKGIYDTLLPVNSQTELSTNAQLAEQLFAKELLPPSALDRDDVVGSTLDPERLNFIREQLHLKYANKEDVNRISPSKSTELHRPKEPLVEKCNRLTANSLQNLNSNKTYKNTDTTYNPKPIKADFNTLQNVQGNVINSEETNLASFPEYSVTKQVTNPAAIEQLQRNMQAVSMRNNETNKNCYECKERINCGDVVVTAEKANEAVWHPGCFVCSVCQELLADLIYFYYKGKLYCGRDMAILMKIPRCYACDELIFVREYTVAEDHNYHVKHFCCWECDKPLAGQQYTPENGRPLCLPCYQNSYAKTCHTCSKSIAADQQSVCVKDLDFHVSKECFCCYECKKSLLNSRILIKEDNPFCSKECYVKYLN